MNPTPEQKLEAKRAYQREYMKMYKHTEKGRATTARYRQGAAFKAAHSRWQKQWREKNKLKGAAHTIVGNAVRQGKLLKLPCEVCSEAKVVAHHDDYYKPLEVRWLCHTHHIKIHCHDAWKKETNNGMNFRKP